MKKHLKQALRIGMLLVIGCGLIAGGFYFGASARTTAEIALPGVSAAASCEMNGCVLSTGYFTNGTEMLHYLDSQSGRLSSALLSRTEQQFIKTFTRLIKPDLADAAQKLNIPVPSNPQFIMVSGETDMRQVGAGSMNNLAKAFVYIAEINSGIVLVYAIPSQGDRDLVVSNGDIIFWTFARLNDGTPSDLMDIPGSTDATAPETPLFNNSGYKRKK
ncbi:MAG: hypothetical protein IKW74_01210 [Thermoguttaceae bacterium]|nr:hypothetical protein [Thermoguttaceae bacterium]